MSSDGSGTHEVSDELCMFTSSDDAATDYSDGSEGKNPIGILLSGHLDFDLYDSKSSFWCFLIDHYWLCAFYIWTLGFRIV